MSTCSVVDTVSAKSHLLLILTFLTILIYASFVYYFRWFTACRAQWLRGRVCDSRLREPGIETCAAVLNPWESLFTLHCSSSLSCINEYLAIDIGGYVYEQSSRINFSIWLDASQRSRDGVWVNKYVREVPGRPGYRAIYELLLLCWSALMCWKVLPHSDCSRSDFSRRLRNIRCTKWTTFMLPPTYNGPLTVGLTSWRK